MVSLSQNCSSSICSSSVIVPHSCVLFHWFSRFGCKAPQMLVTECSVLRIQNISCLVFQLVHVFEWIRPLASLTPYVLKDCLINNVKVLSFELTFSFSIDGKTDLGIETVSRIWAWAPVLAANCFNPRWGDAALFLFRLLPSWKNEDSRNGICMSCEA